MDSSEAEERCFEKRPDGKCSGGIEVARDVPVAALEVADGSITVPAFVGVLCPVHPRGVVGEVGAEMKGVKGEKGRGGQEEDGLDDFESAKGDWGRRGH